MTFFWHNPVVALLGPIDEVRLHTVVCIEPIEVDAPSRCGRVVDIRAGAVTVQLEDGYATLHLDRNQVWHWEGEPVALVAA